MNWTRTRHVPWLAVGVFIAFNAGCAEKSRRVSTHTESNPPMAAPKDKPMKAVPITTVERYAGQILVTGPVIGAPVGRVIRDQAGYDALVATIPKFRVQMKQPAPPNKDPLLKKPKIDFTRHMLVVALRRNMYYGPKITRVLLARGRELIVDILYESPERIHGLASRADVGRYEAVVVPRTDEKPIFRVEKRVRAPD